MHSEKFFEFFGNVLNRQINLHLAPGTPSFFKVQEKMGDILLNNIPRFLIICLTLVLKTLPDLFI